MLRVIFISVITLFAGLHASADGQGKAAEGTAIDAVPRAPAMGGPRRWQVVVDGTLSIHTTPSVDAPIVANLDDRTMLSNLGCETAEDHVWCSIKTIRGKLRGYTLARYLKPAISSDGTVLTGTNNSALRARKGDFDASTRIPCAQERGQPMGECSVEVARSGGGDATVIARFSNGFKRTLYFVHGEFISANATMSGSGTDTDWRKDNGLHIIRVDDQHYELRDEFVVDH